MSNEYHGWVLAAFLAGCIVGSIFTLMSMLHPV